jgi:hypothetical protein
LKDGLAVRLKLIHKNCCTVKLFLHLVSLCFRTDKSFTPSAALDLFTSKTLLMNAEKLKPILLTCFFSITAITVTKAQCIVNSSTGYSVSITVRPAEIIPQSQSCQFGYLYNVRMQYNIVFSGNNIPASLNTLQGVVVCGAVPIFFDLPNNGGNGNVLSSISFTTQTNCATATPASLSCNSVIIQIQGPGIGNQFLQCPLGGPLPVLFSSFTAKLVNDKAQLNWATETEIDNDFFTVQRSTDGINWENIAVVDGAGNSATTQYYTYTDASFPAGKILYRIGQTDFSGTISYSNICQLQTTGETIIRLTPNPNKGNQVFIAGITDFKGVTLSIYDLSGRFIFTTPVMSSIMLLPFLNAGQYVIVLSRQTTGEKKNFRYVKL